eukprot:6381964-Prymnesium_polylepis.1
MPSALRGPTHTKRNANRRQDIAANANPWAPPGCVPWVATGVTPGSERDVEVVLSSSRVRQLDLYNPAIDTPAAPRLPPRPLTRPCAKYSMNGRRRRPPRRRRPHRRHRHLRTLDCGPRPVPVTCSALSCIGQGWA